MPRNLAKKNPESKPVKPGSGSTQEKKKPEPKPKPTEEPTQPTPDPTPKTSEALTEMMLKAHQSGPAIEPGEERGVPDVLEFERGDGCQDAPSLPGEPPAPPVQVIERRIETVTVEIPLGEPPTIPPRVHLEVLLRRDHAHTWARLRQGLRDKGAKTANGRLVDTKPDVMRWLLEQFAGEVGK